MTKPMKTVNLLWCIADTIVCALAIAAYSFGAYIFERWWILLFSLVPLFLYNTHGVFLDAEYEEVVKDDEKL